MNASRQLACALAIGAASLAASAQTAIEHAQHHPNGAAPAAAPSAAGTPEQQVSAMERQLQLMRDMSRRMADAKTPQERQALMAEHQKTLQGGMQMMGQMQGMPMAGMGMGMGMMGGEMMMQRHAMMEKRMEMMQAMLQMMMDRMPAPASN